MSTYIGNAPDVIALLWPYMLGFTVLWCGKLLSFQSVGSMAGCVHMHLVVVVVVVV